MKTLRDERSILYAGRQDYPSCQEYKTEDMVPGQRGEATDVRVIKIRHASKAILSSRTTEQQSNKACIGLLKMSDKYSVPRLESTCKGATA
jgi:hypothetical protein